jgi:hypothetical protein
MGEIVFSGVAMEIVSGVIPDIVAAVHRAIKDAETGIAKTFSSTSHDGDCLAENAFIFLLCQHLLSVPGIKEVPMEDLLPYVAMFWSAAADYDRYGLDEDDAIALFMDLWDRNTTKHARGPLLDIAIKYAEDGYKVPEEAYRYTTEAMQKLVHVCSLLAMLHNNDGKFFLSVENAGKIMGKNKNLGSVSMKRLCSDKILGLVRNGDRASGLASVYVYLPSKTQEA